MEIFFTSQIFPCKNSSFLPVKTALSSLYMAKVKRKIIRFFRKLRKQNFPVISEKTFLFSCHTAQLNNYRPNYSFGLYISLARFKLVTSSSRIWPSFFSRICTEKRNRKNWWDQFTADLNSCGATKSRLQSHKQTVSWQSLAKQAIRNAKYC